jgi:N-acetylmuramoyl-L-alanine amidase
MRFVDIPSPNHFYDPKPIEAVVLHGTASKGIWPAINWHLNPQSQVSANFHISKKGIIYRLVNFEAGKRAWANGIVENYDHSLDWLNKLVKAGKNPNRYTVSIEHEATTEEMLRRASMPDAQFNSSIDLVAYILTKTGLPANNQTVIGHNQISGVNKADCPGVIFPPAYTEQLLLRYPTLGRKE